MTRHQLCGRLFRRGLRFTGTCLLFLWTVIVVTHPILGQNTSACGDPDWLAVQQSYSAGKIRSPLCKAELDAALDHRKIAEKELRRIIQQAPLSADAYEAHSVLSHFYLRIGQFRDAEEQIRAMLAAKPGASDLANVRSLFEILGSYPDLHISPGRPATVSSQIIAGNIFMPVLVNGSSRTYMLDTGIDLSIMSEVEAQRLGLNPRSSKTRLNDISGLSGPELRVVNVSDLVMGNIHVRNVPFLVVADTNGAFSGIPADQHAILGIQPLVAAGTLSFQTDGSVRIGDTAERAAKTVPLLFNGTTPLTQIAYRGRSFTVTFDTGATQTTFNPPFAARYPEFHRDRTVESHTMNGLSGSTSQSSVSVPELRFSFGGDVVLSPAIILLNQTTGTSAWAAANLGFDVIRQAEPLTIDFRRMQIEFGTSP